MKWMNPRKSGLNASPRTLPTFSALLTMGILAFLAAQSTSIAYAQVQTPPGVEQPGAPAPGINLPGDSPTLPGTDDQWSQESRGAQPPALEPRISEQLAPSQNQTAPPTGMPSQSGVLAPDGSDQSPFSRQSPQPQPGDAYLPGNAPNFQYEPPPLSTLDNQPNGNSTSTPNTPNSNGTPGDNGGSGLSTGPGSAFGVGRP